MSRRAFSIDPHIFNPHGVQSIEAASVVSVDGVFVGGLVDIDANLPFAVGR